jgi:hypothetical protein
MRTRFRVHVFMVQFGDLTIWQRGGQMSLDRHYGGNDFMPAR